VRDRDERDGMSKRWTAAMVCSIALVLSGCGGGDKSSLTLVQGAADAVLAKKTARVEMSLGDGTSTNVQLMTGVIDFARQLGSLELQGPDGVRYTIVFSGSTVFLRSGDKPWTRIQLQGRLQNESLAGFGSDPRALLEQLAGAGGIHDLGRDVVRGYAVTHLAGTIDLLKAAEATGVPADQLAELKKHKDDLDGISSTVDVYIGDDGLTHRLVERVTMPSVRVDITLDLLDFGVPVDILLPSSADVRATYTAATAQELAQVTSDALRG
jgi:hypothetical protein